ncbi:C2 domain-containing protein At1g53590-like [Bidens hawaiensis]|uniref:C2 domain-containing protein At1g53590-like n=1 Tax=Bidens hawaiensis TaxID=980011 RepID=UPI00404B5414
MDITEVSIIHHVGIVFLVIWLLSAFNSCHPLVYFISFIYLYLVHENFAIRFRRKVRFEERRQANQKRVLSDSESVRWLNHLVENIWPICMENIVSQKILLPIIPWFLEKYKPWTVKEAMVQNLYLGRSPPMITDMRVCRQSTGDDHLVLELGLNFKTADDMSAILAAKLTKRLGFGMSAKMHITGMHVEGKVLAGIKFLPKWPFLGRMRVCFVEPPYFQMTVKPIFSHGVDVTEVPGIAGWLDKLLTVAFEETLVEPNMLVVDVEKFVSPEQETWFSVDAKEPVGYALVEIVEGSDMKRSDINGLADPYIKGQFGAYRFKTKTQKKTLSPKWLEEFKIPVTSWDLPNLLEIEVHDKDHIYDDALGVCCVKINDFRDGERHDMWLPLKNIKTGRLHIAVTVIKAKEDIDTPKNEFQKENGSQNPPERPNKTETDHLEPIDVEGQRETGIWVQRPGAEVAQVWEPRKGKNRVINKDSESVISSIGSEPFPHESSSTDESVEEAKPKSRNMVKRGFHKVGSLFQRSPKPEDDNKSRNFEKQEDADTEILHKNVRAVNEKGVNVKLVMVDKLEVPGRDPQVRFEESPDGSEVSNSPDKRKRETVKGFMKQTGNSARGLMHAVSRKVSSKGKDNDIGVKSDTSSEVGPVGSPGYRGDGEASPNGLSGPGQVDSQEAGMSPVRSGEVNADDPDRVRTDVADIIDDSRRADQETC